jgi:16S rRNA (cytosine967-C5)-methyltransferase
MPVGLMQRCGVIERPPSPIADPEAPSGLAARSAALLLVQDGLARRGGFEEAMRREGYKALAGPDRAYARLLASTVFRGLGQIDHLLDQRLKSPPPPAVRALLRLGAAQILFRLAPAFASVSTSVALAKESLSTQRFAGLINAILRGLDREGGGDLIAALDPTLNLPGWLLQRWRKAYGDAACRSMALRLMATPPTDLTPRRLAEADEIALALDGARLASGSIRVDRRGEISDWPGFTDGGWWVQDAAAAIAARLFDLSPGDTAIDLCAAPGGKTLQLCAAGAQVTALDRSARRLDRVRENLDRVRLSAELIAADAAGFDDGRRFNAVLLDAPCSATGTFRRHPDVLWGARPADIAQLAAVQSRLLDAAARLTAPKGRLVYSVCSLEPEEGEAQVAAFLARRPEFVRVPILAEPYGLPKEAANLHGDLRLLPGAEVPSGGQDGFFIARFDRSS